ncbi:MAG: hypothetical protein K8T89_21200 [Planctomycetes bacterium]|nr:hypothetical protein [Planctomycetota bacterium]
MESLWPPDIKPDVLSPRGILEMQALALREQTDGLLSAEVRSVFDNAEGAVYLIFDIVSSSLRGTRQRILTVRHATDRIYPCYLDAEGLTSTESAHSDDEIKGIVRRALHTGDVKAIALSLLASSRDAAKNNRLSGYTKRHRGHQRVSRPAWIGVEADEEFNHNGFVDALYDEPQGID